MPPPAVDNASASPFAHGHLVLGSTSNANYQHRNVAERQGVAKSCSCQGGVARLARAAAAVSPGVLCGPRLAGQSRADYAAATANGPYPCNIPVPRLSR